MVILEMIISKAFFILQGVQVVCCHHLSNSNSEMQFLKTFFFQQKEALMSFLVSLLSQFKMKSNLF